MSNIYTVGTNLMIPIPIPKLTDNLNEPGFFAPLEEWKRILWFFTGRDLIDFYAMLEMIIKIAQEARLAKATFNMASDSNSE